MYTCVDTQDMCIIAHALLLPLFFFVSSSLSMRAYGNIIHIKYMCIHSRIFTCACYTYPLLCIADVSYTRTYTGEY